MNRSGRRVIGVTIAAGVLCAGPALVAATPSAADPAGTGDADSSQVADAGTGGGVAVRPDPSRRAHRSKTAAAEAGQLRSGRRVWTCRQWPGPTGCQMWWQGNRNNNNFLFLTIQPIYVPPVVPEAHLSGGVKRAAPRNDLPLTDLPPAALPDSESPAGSAPAAGPPPPAAPVALPRAAPVAVPPAAPVAVPPAAPVVLPPAAPVAVPPAAAPPPPSAEPPASWRLGYPEELRQADIAGILALALPGLAAIAAMTVLGGAVGYRQAKAGYLLPAAGAGRFLQ